MEYYIGDILDKIVGSTSIACETNHDKQSMENLSEVEAVANWLIERLENNADWYGDYRCSANDIAIRTYEIIEKINYVTNELMEIKKDRDMGDK